MIKIKSPFFQYFPCRGPRRPRSSDPRATFVGQPGYGRSPGNRAVLQPRGPGRYGEGAPQSQGDPHQSLVDVQILRSRKFVVDLIKILN